MRALKPGMGRSCFLGALLAATCFSCAGRTIETGVRAGLREAERGRWDEALAGWQNAAQAGRGSAAFHNNLAVAYEEKGLREQASREYQAALAAAPDRAYIRKNWDAFSGAAQKMENSAEVLAAESRDGAERVVIKARFPALLAPEDYAALVIAGFRQERGVPDFDAAVPAAEWAETELRRLVRTDVTRPRPGPGAEIRSDDAAAWRAFGAAFGRALIVAGVVRLDRTAEKSLRESDLPKDGPFKAENRGLAVRTRYSLALGLDFIAADTGAVRLHKDVQKTMRYDSLWESTDIALNAMLVEARSDIAAVFSGEEKTQTRYLLVR